MECPNCKENYKFKQVPLEYRNMKFLVTEFICPFCETWLTPDKKYATSVAVAIVFSLLAMVLIVIGVDKEVYIMSLGFIFAILSVITMLIGRHNLKLEVLDQDR